jgi:hypothetical protein
MIKIKIMKIIYKYIYTMHFIYFTIYRKKYSNFMNIELIEIIDDNNYYKSNTLFFSLNYII